MRTNVGREIHPRRPDVVDSNLSGWDLGQSYYGMPETVYKIDVLI